jgi:hypothetical protein
MDRRSFLKLSAGIAAAANIGLPSSLNAENTDSSLPKCSLCGKPIYAGQEVDQQNGRHLSCLRDAHPLHVCFADGSIHRLVRVKGKPQPGELLYWDMSSGEKNTVCTIQYRDPDSSDKGWRSLAGVNEGQVNDTGWAWIQIKGPSRYPISVESGVIL